MNLTLLKEFFAGFLRTRHIARHLRRLALLENFTDTKVSREVPPTLAQTLVSKLVPGDMIVLSAGDMIPADCRVLSAQGPVRQPGGHDR